MLTTSLLIGLPTALAIFASGAWLLHQRAQQNPTAALINPQTDNPNIDPTIWPALWPHEAPEQPFTRTQAHLAMQTHRGCQIDDCDRKAAAFHALVEFGAIKPSAS